MVNEHDQHDRQGPDEDPDSDVHELSVAQTPMIRSAIAMLEANAIKIEAGIP